MMYSSKRIACMGMIGTVSGSSIFSRFSEQNSSSTSPEQVIKTSRKDELDLARRCQNLLVSDKAGLQDCVNEFDVVYCERLRKDPGGRLARRTDDGAKKAKEAFQNKAVKDDATIVTKPVWDDAWKFNGDGYLKLTKIGLHVGQNTNNEQFHVTFGNIFPAEADKGYVAHMLVLMLFDDTLRQDRNQDRDFVQDRVNMLKKADEIILKRSSVNNKISEFVMGRFHNKFNNDSLAKKVHCDGADVEEGPALAISPNGYSSQNFVFALNDFIRSHPALFIDGGGTDFENAVREKNFRGFFLFDPKSCKLEPGDNTSFQCSAKRDPTFKNQ